MSAPAALSADDPAAANNAIRTTRRRIAANRYGALGLGFVLFLAVPQSNAKSASGDAPLRHAAQVLRRMPLRFEPNRGPVDGEVKFIARGQKYSVALQASAVTLHLGAHRRESLLRMTFLGANPAAELDGSEPLGATSSYFIGNDPQAWVSRIPNYGRLNCRNVYPGVDVVFYGVEGQLEYDFVLAPGADPAAVQVAFEGAQRLRVDQNGDLILTVRAGRLRQHAPVIYQSVGAIRRQVAGRYLVTGNKVRFKVAAYDRSRPLIIDPRLTYSTFAGGDGFDEGVTVASDAHGNAYVTGWTNSSSLPGTPAGYQARYGGGPGLGDAFVAKISPAGELIYTTYLGGSDEDAGWGISVDSLGSAYVSGYTSSTNFPTTPHAHQTKLAGTRNCFVTKLNPSGASLAYSTYLGGAGVDRCLTLAVDSLGFAYASGDTTSTNFPTTLGAFQAKYGGNTDAFVTKLNTTGTELMYSTYLGGSAGEQPNSIEVDSQGNAYIAGFTLSRDFPVIAGSLQTTFGGGSLDSFVTKLNSAGTGLIYSTFIGGNGDEYARAVVVDPHGNAYVAGRTGSTNFPTTPRAFQATLKGQWNAYCLKLDPAGAALVYSTLLGGTAWDQAEGLAVDSSGNAWIAGITQSSDFPVTADALQATLRGNQAGAITHLNDGGTSLIYSSYLGGAGQDAATWVTVDAAGNAYVTGEASSANFPVTAGAGQTRFGGGLGDAFVTRLDACSVAISPSTEAFAVTAGSGAINVAATTDCTWAAVTSVDWISTNSGNEGSGNGTVSIAVAANAGPARTAIIYISDRAFTVSQDGSSACNYGFSPAAETFDLNGGVGSVSVSAAPGCGWTAISSVPWITISTGASAAGGGTVFYSVDPGQEARTGVVIIAGIPLTVSQTVNGPVCNYSVFSLGQAFGGSGGIGGVNVTTVDSCQWAAMTTAPWIRIIGGTPASGSGAVTFAVAANPGSSRRSAALSVAGQDVNITQDGVCTYTMSTAGMAFDLAGGAGAIPVTAASGCTWTAASNVDWITIDSGNSGSSSGAVAFTVSPNTNSRTGTLTVAGSTFTVSQFVLAPGCAYLVDPVRQSLGAAGGAGFITVTAPDGCRWTAAADNWLTLTGQGRSGAGSVAFTAESNSGPARTGTIIVAGQAVTVTQAGACSYGLGAAGQTLSLAGGTGSLALTADPVCAWTATSNDDWISISSSSGTGSGVLAYAAAAGTSARSGTIAIAGQTYTVTETDAEANCSYSAKPVKRSFAAGGGTDTLAVTAAGTCAWRAAASDPWIVLSADSGKGKGTVGFAVAPNNGEPARTGAITVAGLSIPITQPGACSYSVSPAGQSFQLSGGSWVATVTADPGCSWTAVSNSPWVTVTSGDSGSGTGVVSYSVDPGSVARTGTLTIAGTLFPVTQMRGRGFVPIRIHAGGSDYTDPLNQPWSADTSFSGGSTYSTAVSVSGTTTPDLYQSGRTGDSGFQYEFPAPNGSYTVNLKFAEPTFGDSGQRTFHVVVNGQIALANFDIVAQAGGPRIAADKQIPITVRDGKILLQFLPVVDRPIVSAIEIVLQTGVRIAISPAGTVLAPGQQQPFAAIVTSTDNTNVTWSMNPKIGTLSVDGVYTAPSPVSQTQIVTIMATSTADPSQEVTSTIALVPEVQ